MNFTLQYKNKKINLEVKKCNFFQRFSGLMFTRQETARALFFDFEKEVRIPIHSFFVFFPFVAIWLDDKNQVIEKRIVKPWKFSILPKKPFVNLIEIPLNSKYINIPNQFGFLDEDEKI